MCMHAHTHTLAGAHTPTHTHTLPSHTTGGTSGRPDLSVLVPERVNAQGTQAPGQYSFIHSLQY